VDHNYRVGQKTGPLCLTAYIFKTLEPVCVIFGILKHCVILNTFVKSISSKFIKSMVPHSDKLNSVFRLQNEARPLHLDAYFFKIYGPICITFSQNFKT